MYEAYFIFKMTGRAMIALSKHFISKNVSTVLILNPLNPKIKIKILLCCPYLFTIEVVGRS